MQNWTRCSPPSAICRFEWFPAPDVALALVMVGLGGSAALWLSDLPRGLLPWLLPLPVLVLCVSARQWLARPSHRIQLDRHRYRVWVDGRLVATFAVDWRCGLAVLRWQPEQGERCHRCLCLPWRLEGQVVRELRRWRPHSQGTAGVAP